MKSIAGCSDEAGVASRMTDRKEFLGNPRPRHVNVRDGLPASDVTAHVTIFMP